MCGPAADSHHSCRVDRGLFFPGTAEARLHRSFALRQLAAFMSLSLAEFCQGARKGQMLALGRQDPELWAFAQFQPYDDFASGF